MVSSALPPTRVPQGREKQGCRAEREPPLPRKADSLTEGHAVAQRQCKQVVTAWDLVLKGPTLTPRAAPFPHQQPALQSCTTGHCHSLRALTGPGCCANMDPALLSFTLHSSSVKWACFFFCFVLLRCFHRQGHRAQNG